MKITTASRHTEARQGARVCRTNERTTAAGAERRPWLRPRTVTSTPLTTIITSLDVLCLMLPDAFALALERQVRCRVQTLRPRTPLESLALLLARSKPRSRLVTEPPWRSVLPLFTTTISRPVDESNTPERSPDTCWNQTNIPSCLLHSHSAAAVPENLPRARIHPPRQTLHVPPIPPMKPPPPIDVRPSIIRRERDIAGLPLPVLPPSSASYALTHGSPDPLCPTAARESIWFTE